LRYFLGDFLVTLNQTYLVSLLTKKELASICLAPVAQARKAQ
jgi:hypothetical protein